MNLHLTDAQLDHLLVNPAESDPHLATCAQCRAQLTGLRASFADLRSSLTALAEAPPPRQAKSANSRSQARPRVWALAAASLVLGAALVPALHHRQPAEKPVAAVAAPASNQDDEALLEGINQDLSTPVAPSLSPLTIEVRPRQ